MEKVTMRVLTTRLPLSLAQKVDEISQRLDRSKGWILQQALMDWISREEERTRLTLEGLADVDADRTIDESAVRSWVDSLDTDHPSPPPSPSE
jgi:predicted transcriptional regulator